MDDKKHQNRRNLGFRTPPTKVFQHPEKTPDNESLQATTRPGHNNRGQAKAQTKLTCAVSLSVSLSRVSGGAHIEHL